MIFIIIKTFLVLTCSLLLAYLLSYKTVKKCYRIASTTTKAVWFYQIFFGCLLKVTKLKLFFIGSTKNLVCIFKIIFFYAKDPTGLRPGFKKRIILALGREEIDNDSEIWIYA